MSRSLPILAALAALLPVACGAADLAQPAPPPSPADAGPTAAEPVAPTGDAPTTETAMDFYSLKVTSLDGQPVDLSQYRGKVALVVNVASECGFTPQYEGLQQLWREYKDKGLVVLGFPSNDFGGQEPGTPEQIRAFCTERYQVDFPLFAKVQTKPGVGQSEVYRLLNEQSAELPKWNFGKYLVGKNGRVLRYFGSRTTPEGKELRAAIEAALQ